MSSGLGESEVPRMNFPTLSAVAAAVLLVTGGIGGVVAADTTPRTDTSEAPVAPDTAAPTDVDAVDDDGESEPFWLADVEGFLDEFDLTDEQRESIIAEVEQYREDGASTQDVHHMLHYRLYAAGYDTEAVHRTAYAFLLESEYGLSDAEADALVAEVAELREAGEPPRVVRATVVEELAAAGADAPDLADRLAERFDLTESQESELRATVVAELRSGDPPREVLRAVADQLRGFGVTDAELREAVRELRETREDRDRDRPRSLLRGLGPGVTR
jgi:hypothetical protein